MNQTPIRILIHGASGRMGRALLRLVEAEARLRLVGAVTGSGEHDLGGVAQFRTDGMDAVPDFDVAVDFSLAAGFDAILGLCRKRTAGLVSGTTGLDSSQVDALDRASQSIPILWSANFSLGVTVLAELVRRASAALPGWDCDIIESHHIHKLDAPSGTALMLGEASAEVRGSDPHYVSVRAGDIVGEHTVQLTGTGERLELVHRATNRDIFARGALHAAAWLAGQTPGRYAMKDCLGLE